jgi:Protein of unknown function (DUF3037)
MLRDESVNIAIVMVGDDFADVRIVCDWQCVLELDPDADILLLKQLACDIREKLRNKEQRKEMLSRMEQSFSNAIQLSPWKGCLTEDPATEIETLAARYL